MADRSAEVAARLLAGVEHLKAGRLQDAITELAEVCSDEDLRRADDLRDVRARAMSMLADAHLRAGDVDSAETMAREALALLREVGDANGVRAVQDVWGRVAAARQEAQAAVRREVASARLREMTRSDLGDRFGEGSLRLADALVKKAHAHADVDDTALAEELAHEALALSRSHDSVREEVFARLALARVGYDATEQVRGAWERAERADEFNLVSAIASAADSLGVALPVLEGPVLPSPDHDPDSLMS